MKMILQEKRAEKGDAVSFIWKPGTDFDWLPGQYLQYEFPHQNPDDRGALRWFTISSAPFEKVVMQTTRIVEKRSSFKKALFDLPLGSEIEAEGPKGKFVISDINQFYVLIAGGIGITPFRSILAESLHDKAYLNGVLLYQNKDQDFVFEEELEQYAAENAAFRNNFLTEDISADLILDQIPVGVKPLFYISGPEGMVEHYKKVVLDLGFAEEQVKTDDFPGYDWPLV